MKTCPVCDTAHPNHYTNCPTDGARLIESRDLQPGTVVCSKYRIERVLGRGGMGTVYLAQHILLDEPRALKFMSSELSQDAKFLKRFRMEAKASIALQHPNIVGVLDLDQAEDGSPFIAMEYVEGRDLRAALAEAPFPVERALAIARGVALGLTKAHAKGIVHRDIKPENILLAHEPGGPEVPKILDFGIAAMKESTTAISRTRGLMLTPEYAAPEQWKGLPAQELDGGVDLYALGGVLHEMLTGSTGLHADNMEGWMYQHLHVPPETPSKVRPELARWKGLDELVLRLLEKNRDQRTASAETFVRELDAVRPGAIAPIRLEETVVEVGSVPPPLPAPPQTAKAHHSPVELTLSAEPQAHLGRRRWLARPLLIGAALLMLVAVGIYATSSASHRENAHTSDVPQLPEAGKHLPQQTRVLGLSDQADPKQIALWRTLKGHASQVLSVAPSPDGRWLASGSGDRTIRLWDVTNGQDVRTFTGHTGSVGSVAFSPDGRWLASGSEDHTVKLWNVGSGAEVRTLRGHTGAVYSVAFSPDGHWLASASEDHTIKLWDGTSGQDVRTFTGHTGTVYSVAFSPDGRWLASGSEDHTVKLWNVGSGAEVRTLKGHAYGVSSVAFSPDGHWLASGSLDNTVKLWDAANGQEVRALEGHVDGVWSVAFSPDSRWLASGSTDNKVRLWEVTTGAEVRALEGHVDQVWSVAFGPDGRWLASGSRDNTIKLWKLTS